MTRDAARQFAPLADAYAASRSHAEGRTLALVVEGAEAGPSDLVLDVATGGGHIALALARRARAVVATDLTPAMVARALASARERGLGNLAGVVAAAEALPLPSACVDAVACRTAAHHFDDLPAALAEMRRVLRPGGRLALSDLAAAEEPALRALQHRIELLHDPTHRRTCTPAEWRSLCAAAGFRDVRVEGGVGSGLDELAGGTNVAAWCARSRTPPAAEAEIRRLLEAEPARREALRVTGEGAELRFAIEKLVVLARA